MTAPLRKDQQTERNSLTTESLSPKDSLEIAPPGSVERIRLEPKRELAANDAQFAESTVGSQTATTAETGNVALFPGPELREMQGRWDQIQTAFVDDPKTAVHDADALVSSAIGRLSDVFEGEHAKLEERWQSGSDLTTEDLRVALQRYRSFFQRLLSV